MKIKMFKYEHCAFAPIGRIRVYYNSDEVGLVWYCRGQDILVTKLNNIIAVIYNHRKGETYY